MKYIWEPNDIIPGRIVCKHFSYQRNDAFIPCGNSAKWTYKIGYRSGGDNGEKYVLVCMADGLVRKGTTREKLAEDLNADELIPMPHKWFIKQMDWLRDSYEH